jgi:hypothetical protein
MKQISYVQLMSHVYTTFHIYWLVSSGDNYMYTTACTQFVLLLSVVNMQVSFVCLYVSLYPDSDINLSISGLS